MKTRTFITYYLLFIICFRHYNSEMKLLFGTNPQVFSLLSIGQRGVGKTVFLAGSYAELHSTPEQENRQRLWFDCRDSQAQKNIESILSYVARTGQYPPATMKITNFNLTLKRRHLGGNKTLCHFRWWDIPGESCNMGNPDFQKMVMASHGCCVFINANALVCDPTYLQSFEEIVRQVVAIASLVNQDGLNYPFALIFTQCDQLEPGPLSRLQIEENLQPLIARLDAVKAKYQRFYSTIPIVSDEGISSLKAAGAAAPILWLVSELKKTDNLKWRPELGSGLEQGLSTSKLFRATSQRHILSLVLASLSLLGVSAALFLTFGLFTHSSKQAQSPEERIREYERVLQGEPNNLESLIHLSNLHLELGQLDQAIPLLEKIVQQEPENHDWHLNLAELYELTGQKQKAETAYDQILAQQENNLRALIDKALLRSEQGDIKTARTLFEQAEKAAPTGDLKAKVRAIAQSTLQPTAESMPFREN